MFLILRGASVHTADRREAERICNEIQKIEDKARSGRLTPDRARKVIESTVADIMESFGTPIQQVTIREHFTKWIKSREAECSPGTSTRYKGIVDNFLLFLGPKASRPLPALQSSDIDDYRQSLIGNVSNSTVNTHLKVLRVCLEKAVKQNIFDKNPARMVDNLDRSDRHRRRPFTLDELRKIIAVASDDWRTAIYFGLYTGMRLSDVCNLTWANLDLQRREMTVETQKTKRVQNLPLARPLLAHVEKLPTSDDPEAPLAPSLFGVTETLLSNQFYELLASVGLVPSRKDHRKQGKGRGVRRRQSEITFHSLRHTATSLLKNAGVSNAITQDIIGHESEAISRNYTHIETDTKRAALDKMPDLSGENG
jgi:integrase